MAREKDMPEASMDAAEYALGVMDAKTRASFERRLADDPALQGEVAFWENRMSSMADGLAPVAPPPSVFNAIERRLFAAPPAIQPGLWQSLGFWRSLSFASLAAAVVLAGVVFMQTPPSPSSSSTHFAELSGESKVVRLAVAYDAGAGLLKLNRVEGAAATGRSLELWVIEGGNAPVSLGVLPQAAQASISVPESIRAKLPNAVLAISDEPLGGSPTGAPTGAVLATGQVLTVS